MMNEAETKQLLFQYKTAIVNFFGKQRTCADIDSDNSVNSIAEEYVSHLIAQKETNLRYDSVVIDEAAHLSQLMEGTHKQPWTPSISHLQNYELLDTHQLQSLWYNVEAEDGALTSLTFKFDENCVAPVGGTYKSEPTRSLCVDSTKNLTQVDFYINGGKIY